MTSGCAQKTGPAPVLMDDSDVSRQLIARVHAVRGDLLEECEGVDVASSSDSIVLVADVRRSAWLIEASTRVRQAGATGVCVFVEPGRLWFGPVFSAHIAGCPRCLKGWVNNNYRDEYHWSASTEAATVQRALRPTSPAALNILVALLANAIEAARTTPERLQASSLSTRFDLDRLTVAHHHFIEHPDCPDCDRRPADSEGLAQVRLEAQPKEHRSEFRRPNSALSLSGLRRDFVDRHTGLIKHTYLDLASDLTPMFASELPISDSSTDIEYGFGRAETREKSQLIAIIEALERYCGHAPRRRITSVRGSFDSMRDHAVDPAAFVLHQPAQARADSYRMTTYSETLEFNWVWGESVVNNVARLVPEQLVYYWLTPDQGKSVHRFVYDSSNGCAMGGTLVEAALSGLLELVERDAYFTTWYGKFARPRIDLDSIDDERIGALLARARAEGFELHVFDNRLDIDVPVVIAMIVDPRPDPQVKSYCAAGAALLPADAVYSALVEVTTSMGVYRKSLPAQRERAELLASDYAAVTRMSDHVLLYSLESMFGELQFLFDDCDPVPMSDLYDVEVRDDLKEDFLNLAAKVSAVASDVLVIDQTAKSLEAHGLKCAKVLAPGLSPVTFGHQYRRVALDRINRAAKAIGHGVEFDHATVNQTPHNFP